MYEFFDLQLNLKNEMKNEKFEFFLQILIVTIGLFGYDLLIKFVGFIQKLVPNYSFVLELFFKSKFIFKSLKLNI